VTPTPHSLRVRPIDPIADPRWDAFVATQPGALGYHLGAWAGILAAAYRFRPVYLVAEDAAGALHGALPMVGKWGPVSRSRLRSLPAVQSAGPLADHPAVAAQLMTAALALARERGAILVVDSRTADLDAGVDGLSGREQQPTWIMDVPAPEEIEAWERSRPRNLRRSIRKAADAGLTVRHATAEADMRAFHRLYLKTMRRHRSVPRTRRHFLLLQRSLQERGAFALFLVERVGQPVAGVMFHVFNGLAELMYNASDESMLAVRPNHGLYRQVVEWAAQRGLRRIDFGGAWPGSSLAAFKQQWGAEIVPEYRYVGSDSSAPVDVGTAMSERAPGRVAREIDRLWGRAPLAATAAAGELAYRWL
jgi:hypothetical protein